MHMPARMKQKQRVRQHSQDLHFILAQVMTQRDSPFNTEISGVRKLWRILLISYTDDQSNYRLHKIYLLPTDLYSNCFEIIVFLSK